MDVSNESNMNTKIVENHYHNHVYNIKEGKHPFLLQFKQLKYYYNERKKFKNYLSIGAFPQENNKKDNNQFNPKKIISQNMYCLIDRKWLKKWKKHIGYKEIKNKMNENKIERDLDNKDYKWISEIIDKNYKENYLIPYDNNIIYKKDEIDPSIDFKAIHKDSFKLFNLNSETSDKNKNYRKYPIRLLKDKYIIFLSNEIFYIFFKNINSQKYNEIIIYFIETKENNEKANKNQSEEIKGSKKKIIDIFTNNDINEWLKEINFNLFEIEKELEYNNCKIRIYNKTLLRIVETHQMRNSIFPSINNERNELLNSNTLSNGLTKIVEIQSKANQFMMRDRKSIDNNNNNNNNESIITEMVFESIKELKENNLKSSIITLNNGENNNNIKIENNNNKKIDELNCKTSTIINRANIDNNIDDQPPNSNQNIDYDNRNKSEFKNNQINNYIKSQVQSQPSFPQNQNNNFNSYNNQNNNNSNYNNQYNNNSNYNNQNQIPFNNNIPNQNYNSQSLFQNNNINIFNQQNNQSANFNNVQSQMLNSFPMNCNQNMQFYNVLQNMQNNNLLPNNFQQNFNDYQIMMMMNIYNNFMNSQNNKNVQSNNNIGKQYPHKSGLQNIGQTCYMNATIECLSNIQEITDYLLNLNENFIPTENNLTISYRSLLIELFLSGQKCIVPHVFKSVIGELNPLFQGMHAADSKDLVFFIIERLHLELNEVNKNIPNMHKDFYQLELESRDGNLMLQNFFSDFKLKNNSIISKTFYGITRSIMECKGCGIKKYSFQSFNMQIFQLKKLKEDKLLYYQNNTKLNLTEAFILQQMPESLTNENMIYCNNCKGLTDGAHQQSIYELPKVLIIILNRGKNNEDFNEEFDFPVKLDLRNQNVIVNPNSPHLFYLCGIITHLGESSSGGHFIAYCRNNQNSNFTFYNDSIVSEASVESAISAKISDNVNEKRTPYILFYHYI